MTRQECDGHTERVKKKNRKDRRLVKKRMFVVTKVSLRRRKMVIEGGEREEKKKREKKSPSRSATVLKQARKDPERRSLWIVPAPNKLTAQPRPKEGKRELLTSTF